MPKAKAGQIRVILLRCGVKSCKAGGQDREGEQVDGGEEEEARHPDDRQLEQGLHHDSHRPDHDVPEERQDVRGPDVNVL